MNVSLYSAAAAMTANGRWQDIISQNLASSSVPGYKKQELVMEAAQSGLMPAMTSANAHTPKFFSIPKAGTQNNFSAGDMLATGNKNDVAIEGKGFFQVQLPNGTTAYTRDGEFQVNAQGQLVTKEGYTVMGQGGSIQIDTRNPHPFSISASGEVGQGAESKGKLKLVDFTHPEQLQPLSGSYFAANNSSAGLQSSAKGTFRQGYVESSNTSTVREMANMITAMRTFEANQKVVQMQDDRMGKAISELGNPGA